VVVRGINETLGRDSSGDRVSGVARGPTGTEALMTTQVKAALIAAVVGLIFVALEIVFKVSTAVAGVFVIGMAGGLLIGDQMAQPAKQ
jgi:hypothetical protein